LAWASAAKLLVACADLLRYDDRTNLLVHISGTATITGLHTPALFFCGGKEGTNGSVCDNIQKVASSVEGQPSTLINNPNADHGSWVYEGAKGVELSGLAACFRLRLMGDTSNRKQFYGDGCTFCNDTRVKVYQQPNDPMTRFQNAEQIVANSRPADIPPVTSAIGLGRGFADPIQWKAFESLSCLPKLLEDEPDHAQFARARLACATTPAMGAEPALVR
jgi:hypothetical protein